MGGVVIALTDDFTRVRWIDGFIVLVVCFNAGFPVVGLINGFPVDDLIVGFDVVDAVG